jgi:ribosomal protein L31
VPHLPPASARLRGLVAALALAGCGSAHHRAANPSPTAFPPTLQTADCDQWNEMRAASKQQLVEQMTLFFGARVNDQYGRGQTLPTDQAFRVLTDGCHPAYAGAVKLYKLYGRAAAFTP